LERLPIFRLPFGFYEVSHMLRQIFLMQSRSIARTINQLVLQKSVVAYEKPHKIVDMVSRRTQVNKKKSNLGV